MILSYFPEFKVSAAVTRSTRLITNGVSQPPTWAAVDTYNVLAWDSSSGEQFVSDRFRESVDVLYAFPIDADVKPGDRVTIGSDAYNVIHADDVGRAGEYLLVSLREYDNGTA